MDLSFDRGGLLTPGDYPMTLGQLRASLLVVGPESGYPLWDREWRGQLVDNLAIVVRQLWQVGVTEIFVGGSFAEDNPRPNDIDGYFVCGVKEFASGQLEARLNRIDPYRCWNLSGWPTMRRRYHIDLWASPFGQISGIPGPKNEIQDWPTALRRSKHRWKPRGVVKIEVSP